MLTISFVTRPVEEAGKIFRHQLDEALHAIGFVREEVQEAIWNGEARATQGVSAPAVSDLSDAKGAEAPRRRGRPSKQEAAAEAPPAPAVEEKPQISANPENRVEPVAETAPAQPEAPAAPAPDADAKPLTHDDVRGALGRYVTKFGGDAAREDGPKILGVAKISDLPNEQPALKKAVEASLWALEENPYGRVVVGGAA